MQSLDTLPADVIFEILVRLPNLRSLHDVICTGRRIYDIYNARRSLVLTRVYENGLASIFHNVKLSRIQEILIDTRGLQTFCQRSAIPRHDAVPLRLVVWKNMIKHHVHVWYCTDFCQKLILLCQATSNVKLASEIAEDARRAIIDRYMHSMDPGLRGPPYRQEAERFTKWLADFYCTEKKPEAAIELLYHFYQSRDFPSDNRIILSILKVMRANPGTVFEDRLLATLRSRCNQNKSNDQPTSTSRYAWKDYCFSMESYLHFVCIELNRPSEAMTIVQNALNLMPWDAAALARVLAMARRQIRFFKQTQQGYQVLISRKLILAKIHEVGVLRIDISMYLAWAKDYAADARFFGFPDIALDVEEQVLDKLNSLRDDSWTVVRRKFAAQALSRAYGEAGLIEKAHALQEAQHNGVDETANREGGEASQHSRNHDGSPVWLSKDLGWPALEGVYSTH